MPEWVTDVLGALEPWWPFVAKVIVIWYLGQVFKKRIWTKGRALEGGFFGFMRTTLPFHPLVAGVAWGALYPWMPAVAIVASRGGAITEGLIAGVVTVAGHTGLEWYAEKKNIGWILAILRDTVKRPSNVPPPIGK